MNPPGHLFNLADYQSAAGCQPALHDSEPHQTEANVTAPSRSRLSFTINDLRRLFYQAGMKSSQTKGT